MTGNTGKKKNNNAKTVGLEIRKLKTNNFKQF